MLSIHFSFFQSHFVYGLAACGTSRHCLDVEFVKQKAKLWHVLDESPICKSMWDYANGSSFPRNFSAGVLNSMLEFLLFLIENLKSRGDSMIFTFHVPPLASGEGICYIDRV